MFIIRLDGVTQNTTVRQEQNTPEWIFALFMSVRHIEGSSSYHWACI